jgi:hypothetical protein
MEGGLCSLYSMRKGVSNPNADPTEGHNCKAAPVPYLEYYYPMSSANTYLSTKIKGYPGIQVEVAEGVRNLWRTLGRKLVDTTN